MSAFPPRRKDWKQGRLQIGLFVRMPDGSRIESTWDDASDSVREKAVSLLLTKFPQLEETLRKLIAEAPKGQETDSVVKDAGS